MLFYIISYYLLSRKNEMAKKTKELGLKDTGYNLFLNPDEEVVYAADSMFDKIIKGVLVLTNKRVFFYYVSNICRDKKFLASYPYILSADVKEGIFSSTLFIKTKQETFIIRKLDKTSARKFKDLLDNIIKDNKA